MSIVVHEKEEFDFPEFDAVYGSDMVHTCCIEIKGKSYTQNCGAFWESNVITLLMPKVVWKIGIGCKYQ